MAGQRPPVPPWERGPDNTTLVGALGYFLLMLAVFWGGLFAVFALQWLLVGGQ